MQHRTFGRLGWRVSEIGHGLWGMAGWSGSDDEMSLRALDRACGWGATSSTRRSPTATATASGCSRGPWRSTAPGVSTWRRRSRRRTASGRAAPTNHLTEVFPADHIRAYTERSLQNLGVDCIDLQQFHVWSDAWAHDDRWKRAVEDLKREGLIRGFGISVNRWQPANVLKAIETGLVDAVQVVYNVFDQAPEDELFPACQEHNVAVIARVPFDEGSLTGTLTPETTWPEGDFRKLYFSEGRLEESCRRVDRLREVLPEGMSLPELALRFILHHPAVSTVIPGMRRSVHVERNLAASDGKPLPEDLLASLRLHRWDRDTVLP